MCQQEQEEKTEANTALPNGAKMPKTEPRHSMALQRQWQNNGQEKTKRGTDMKKSERYYIAMLAVINSNHILADDKIEILEELMDKRDIALWTEKEEAKKQEEKNGESV